MLVLSRKQGETIRIATTVEVTVLEVRNGRVKLGVSGPPQTKIYREELYRRLNDAPDDRTHVDIPSI